MLLANTSGAELWTAIATVALAVVTLVLAVAAIVAGVAAWKQLSKQGDELRDQREAFAAETHERNRIVERQNKLDERQEWLDESEQARQVGRYTKGGGPWPVELFIVNGSGLSIARVEALATAEHRRYRLELCGHQGFIVVIDPHETLEVPPRPT